MNNFILFSTNGTIDKANGFIRGVSLITQGQVLGHECFADAETNRTVLTACQKLKKVKTKFNHGTDVGSIVGYLINFRIEGNQVKADLQLLKDSGKCDYIFSLAENLNNQFGLSIAFEPSFQTINNKEFVRCGKIYSADIVDSPAANPNGLFSKGNQIMKSEQTSNNDYALQNASVIAKYAGKNMQITHFQSSENDGWVPTEGGNEPDWASQAIEAIKNGNIKLATDILNQISRTPTVTPSTAVKGNVNKTATTRGTVHVKTNDGRATIIDGTSFDNGTGGQVFMCQKGSRFLEGAAKEVNEATTNRVAKSHNQERGEVSFRNETCHKQLTAKQKQFVAEKHVNSIEAATGIDRASVLFCNLNHEDLTNNSGKLEALSARLAQMKF